ncbi:hypothetical protein GCM10022254_36150 [Actinomadura meridiana]|uniref:Uncharacterized protein n=1 Tax=Actinomadura meridiana TaxID=559626 RepID=A0ABP8C4P2_9ACTN
MGKIKNLTTNIMIGIVFSIIIPLLAVGIVLGLIVLFVDLDPEHGWPAPDGSEPAESPSIDWSPFPSNSP